MHYIPTNAKSVQVRILVVYSRWVQVFTAKTTRRYVTSIVNGWKDIADHMEISQTPWFNFTDKFGQQQVLLFALEWSELQSPIIRKSRMPLNDMEPHAQNSKFRKRKLDTGREQSDKRQKGEHGGNRAKEASGIV